MSNWEIDKFLKAVVKINEIGGHSKDFSKPGVKNLRFYALVPLLFCLPLVAILGTRLAAISGDNSVLLLLVVGISAVVLCAPSKRLVHPETYPLAVLAISLSLLLHVALISKYLIGYDVHIEYHFAKLTSMNSIWDRTIPNEYNAMSSITILPAIYSNLLNLDLNWVFKPIYPLVYSLVPLILYLAYRKQTSSRIAFLSVFFFMSFNTFYFQMLGLIREMIAELFFALLILLMVQEKMLPQKRELLFVIFSVGLIQSHYALSYIFMFYALLTFCLLPLLKRDNVKSRKLISAGMMLLYFVMAFFWYIFISPVALQPLTNVSNHIYNQILEYVSGPGLSLMPSFVSPVHEISKYLFYIFQFFILVGLTASIVAYREKKFNEEYFAMAIASVFILIACMFVPFVAASFRVERFYHITLFFLAPFSVLGGMTILSLTARAMSRLSTSANGFAARVHRSWPRIVSVLLVSFFLFQVGFVYEITGDSPASISLAIGRKDAWLTYMHTAYTPEHDVFGARWLYRNVGDASEVYGDSSIYHVLTSYAMISGKNLFLLSNHTEIPNRGSYIYLRSFNVVYGMLELHGANLRCFPHGTWPDYAYGLSNTTQIEPPLSEMNKIYSNGETEVYYRA